MLRHIISASLKCETCTQETWQFHAATSRHQRFEHPIRFWFKTEIWLRCSITETYINRLLKLFETSDKMTKTTARLTRLLLFPENKTKNKKKWNAKRNESQAKPTIKIIIFETITTIRYSFSSSSSIMPVFSVPILASMAKSRTARAPSR